LRLGVFARGLVLKVFLDGLKKVADVFEGQDFALGEFDVEFEFDGDDEVDVGEGIPAFDVIGGHGFGELDGVVGKYLVENFGEAFVVGHFLLHG